MKKKKKKIKKHVLGVVFKPDDKDIYQFEYIIPFYTENDNKEMVICYNEIADMRKDGWTEEFINSFLELEVEKYRKYFY